MNTKIYKIKLIEEKNLLEEELGSLGRVDKDGDWEAVPEEQSTPQSDENDMADRSEDFQERSSILNTLEARLIDVKKAISKIESTGYGICESCKINIEKERLNANPAARTCEHCM